MLKFFKIHRDTWHQTMTLHLVLRPTFIPCLSSTFFPFFFFFVSKNPLKKYVKFLKKFFLSIVWWLSEEVGFSYGVTSWNKYIIAKWQSVEFINYIYIYHHHHVAPPARISLTLSCHFSLSFIASGRSSELHPVSSHSCCM